MIAKDWFSSSACGANNSCVDVRFHADGTVEVRNSNEPSGPTLSFTPDEWGAFLEGARVGEFDLP